MCPSRPSVWQSNIKLQNDGRWPCVNSHAITTVAVTTEHACHLVNKNKSRKLQLSNAPSYTLWMWSRRFFNLVDSSEICICILIITIHPDFSCVYIIIIGLLPSYLSISFTSRDRACLWQKQQQQQQQADRRKVMWPIVMLAFNIIDRDIYYIYTL